MPTKVLLAPVGAGKTEVALERLVSTVKTKPFAKVWTLLATKRQEEAFRKRLSEWDDGRTVYFNVGFFNFYELYSHLLDLAAVPHRRLNDTARLRMLRAILSDLQRHGQLSVYSRIAHTPGFVRVVADFIYELKQNRVYPQYFESAAHTAKDRELARIYSTYQQRLIDHNLVDREGEGWLALDVLEHPDYAHIAREVDFLLVDGYDQFTVVQADLLTLLADRAHDTLITLTTVPTREETAGRRFQQALERLQERHRHTGQTLHIQSLTQSGDDRHPDLKHLADNILRLDALVRPAGDGLTLLEAPDPAQEVGAVLRRVKRLLLEQNAKPDDILIALRKWELYQTHFIALGREYQLPLALHYGEPLAQNPAIIALLMLLDLPENDFRRRDLLDVLRSPYFQVPGLATEQADALERISQAYLVTGGREAWLRAVQAAGQMEETESLDDLETALFRLGETPSHQLVNALSDFFNAVTPPPESKVDEYIFWLELLIGPDPDQDPDDEAIVLDEDNEYRLRMLWRLREPAPQHVIARDLGALHEFKNILRNLLSAQELLASLGESRQLTWQTFLTDLKSAINSASIDPRPGRVGRVLVTTAADARGLPHDHVFILGLSERVFPAQIPEDPLYLDSERRRFRDAGVFLATQAERAADDGLFYELISLPHKSLTLSRPTVQDGKIWIESHLWRAVQQVFTDLTPEKIAVGAVVGASEAASLSEAALSIADSFNLPPVNIGGDALRLYQWIQPQTYWARVELGRAVEIGRMSRRPHNRYSGRLEHDTLIAHIAAQLGPDYVWSATKLNDLGACSFRFFAKHLLGLDDLVEPEEGMDTKQLGTLNHEILEKTYRQLRDKGASIIPEFADLAVEILRQVASDSFGDAPDRLGFRATPLWEHEKRALLQRLETLVRLDFSGGDVLPFSGVRQPYFLEVPFGMSGAAPAKLPVGEEILSIRGKIDRMDRMGDTVVVIDYKTGSTKIQPSEIEAGRNFQMMVYLAAAAQLLNTRTHPGAPHTVAGGVFWHIRDGSTSRPVDKDADELERGRSHLARYLSHIRQGDFAVHANKPDGLRCTRYCEFSQMCRVGSTNRGKRDV